MSSPIAIVTFAEVQACFDTLEDTDQAFVEGLINTASAEMERRVGGFLRARERIAMLHGNGATGLILPDRPAVSVANVSIDGTAVTDYYLDQDTGLLYRNGRWPEGRYNIQVKATYGYVVVPPELKDACIRLVIKAWRDYRNNRLGVKSSTGLDGVKTDYETGVPFDVYSLLDLERTSRKVFS